MRRLTRHAKTLSAALIAGCAALALAGAANADDVRRHTSINGVFADYDFSGEDLSKTRLSGVFPRADFSGADLSETRLRGNYAEAMFPRADLRDAVLAGANFRRADFSGADLSEARLNGSNFAEANFTGAQLQESRLSGGNFSGAIFVSAKLAEAHLGGSNLDGADFSGADMVETHLQGVNLADAQFRNAQLLEAQLQGANLRGAVFDGANLTEVRLHHTNLSGAKLDETIGLQRASLEGACGDETTRLPEGLSVKPCHRPRLASRTDMDPVSIVIRTHTDGGMRDETVITLDANENIAIAREALMASRAAVRDAFEAAHLDLNRDVRAAVKAARDVLDDAHVEIMVTEELAQTDQVRVELDAALAEARASIQDAASMANGGMRAALNDALAQLDELQKLQALQFEGVDVLVGRLEQERRARAQADTQVPEELEAGSILDEALSLQSPSPMDSE